MTRGASPAKDAAHLARLYDSLATRVDALSGSNSRAATTAAAQDGEEQATLASDTAAVYALITALDRRSPRKALSAERLQGKLAAFPLFVRSALPLPLPLPATSSSSRSSAENGAQAQVRPSTGAQDEATSTAATATTRALVPVALSLHSARASLLLTLASLHAHQGALLERRNDASSIKRAISAFQSAAGALELAMRVVLNDEDDGERTQGERAAWRDGAMSKDHTFDDAARERWRELQDSAASGSSSTGAGGNKVEIESPDLFPESLDALRLLMLAQAQECYWAKAVMGAFMPLVSQPSTRLTWSTGARTDKLKNTTIAKLAVAVSALYTAADKAFTHASAHARRSWHFFRFPDVRPRSLDTNFLCRRAHGRHSREPQSIVNFVRVKKAHFAAAAHFRKSLDDLASNRYGEEISRLERAQASVQEAMGVLGRGKKALESSRAGEDGGGGAPSSFAWLFAGSGSSTKRKKTKAGVGDAVWSDLAVSFARQSTASDARTLTHAPAESQGCGGREPQAGPSVCPLALACQVHIPDRETFTAHRDNTLIYHHVPPAQLAPLAPAYLIASSVPAIACDMARDPPPVWQGARLTRWLFDNVVPLVVIEACALWDDRRTQALRAHVDRQASEADERAASQLSQMGLPGSLDASTQPAGLPTTLVRAARAVRQAGGAAELRRQLADVRQLANTNAALVSESAQLLAQERADDERYRQAWGSRQWTRADSDHASATLRERLVGLQASFTDAQRSDSVVRRKFADAEKAIDLLAVDEDELAKAVPSATLAPLDSRAPSKQILAQRDLRRLLDSLAALQAERGRLVEDGHKTVESKDLTDALLSAAERKRWSELAEFDDLLNEELDAVVVPWRDALNGSLARQDDLMDQIKVRTISVLGRCRQLTDCAACERALCRGPRDGRGGCGAPESNPGSRQRVPQVPHACCQRQGGHWLLRRALQALDGASRHHQSRAYFSRLSRA